MGNPQPLKMPEQNVPSFVPRTSKAMRIQRVTFPWEQQFINTSCVFRRMYVYPFFLRICVGILRLFFLIYHIPRRAFFVCKRWASLKKYRFLIIYTADFVAKIKKKRYNDIILRYALGKYAMQFDREWGSA